MPEEPGRYRGWVAHGQPDVLQGHGFLYRPRQVLFGTGRAWSPTVASQLQRDGGVPDDELNRGFAEAKLPVRAYLMPPEVNIPRLVDRLRERDAGDPVPDVGPNHVFCGEPNYEGGPDGEPLNAAAINEAPYGKPDPRAPTIAVLDTGYDPSVPALHPGLDPRVSYPAGSQENPITSSNYIAAEGGHGTFIDGIIMRLAPQVPHPPAPGAQPGRDYRRRLRGPGASPGERAGDQPLARRLHPGGHTAGGLGPCPRAA